MSAVTRPRGPLPARVYWTRRAAVLGVAFLMVFTLARVLGGGSDGGDGGSDQPDQAAPVAGEPTGTTTGSDQTGKPRDGKGEKKDDSKKPRKPELAQPDGPCDVADLTIRANLSSVASSTDIRIPLKLTTSVPACTFDVSQETVVVKITSGRDSIWSSQDCRGIELETVVVRAEKPAWARLVWNGKRSGIACGRSAQWALPGWYHVSAAPLGGEPTDTMFELTPRKAERITQAPEPKNDDKDKKKNQT